MVVLRFVGENVLTKTAPLTKSVRVYLWNIFTGWREATS